MADMRYDIEIGYSANKQSLSTLQADLKAISNTLQNMSPTQKMDVGIQKSINTVGQLNNALRDCYDVDLGKLNTAKFSEQLKKADISVKDLKADLTRVGPEGAKAFNSIGSAILSTNLQIKQGSKLLDDFARTFTNTIKYNISGGIYRSVVSSVQQAINYTKHLDTSLNDIRIVTDKSAESMQKFAKQANEAAKSLGKSTIDYTEASLIYYQQGLSDEDVKARTDVTLKAANVTGQATSQVSEQLTAVWNGYKVDAEEAELCVDKLAAVAATTASDLEELSTGMSKVASAANAMGVDVDQLNAQLATIVSVTRQAPESVGTALKTIYARMSTIEAGGEDEGTKLKNYTEQMAQFGFNVLDSQGKLRDMGTVIEEIGGKWNTLSREQQVALAQTMAGTRQYNNLLALFENWDMYSKALKTSTDAVGTLQKQQDIYMESTKAHLQQTQTATQELYDTLIKTTELNWGVDQLTNAIEVINDMVDAFGGGLKSFAGVGIMIAGIFSKQIGNGLNGFIDNLNVAKKNAEALKLVTETIEAKSASLEGKTGKTAIAQKAGLDAQLKSVDLIKNTVGNTEVYNNLVKKAEEESQYVTKAALEREVYNDKLQESYQFLEAQNIEFDKEVKDATTLADLGNQLDSRLQENLQLEKSITTEKKEKINAQKLIVETSKQEIEQDKQRIAQLKEYLQLEANRGKGGAVTNKQTNLYESLTGESKDAASSQTYSKFAQEAAKEIEQLEQKIRSNNNAINEAKKTLSSLKTEQQEQIESLQLENEMLEHYRDTLYQVSDAEAKATEAEENALRLKNEINSAVEREIENQLSLGAALGNSLAILGSASMAWMSFSSILTQIKNVVSGDANIGEALSKIVLTSTMLVPNIITTVNKMKELLPTEQLLTSYKEIQLDKMRLQNVEQGITKINDAEILRDKMQQLGYTEAIEKVNERLKLLTEGEANDEATKLRYLKEELALEQQRRASSVGANKFGKVRGGIGIGFQNIGKAGAAEAAAEKAGVSAAAAGATATAISALLIAAATAAVVIGGFNLAAYELGKTITSLAEKFDNQANALQKSRQSIQGELDNLQSLQEAYHQLDVEHATDEASKKQLQNATYQLCLQYGEEALAIKSLTASYEELDSIMTNLSADKLEEIQKSAIREQGLRKQGLITQLDAIWSPFDSLGQGIVNTDLHMSDSEKAYAQAIAESIGLDKNAFMSGNGASMNVYDYIDDIAAHQEEFFNTMESMSNGGDFEKELKKIFTDDFKATVVAYGKAIDDANEATKQIAINSFDNTIADYKDFNNRFDTALKELTNNAFNGDSAEARKYLLSELAKSNFNDDISSYIQTESIATRLIGADAAPEELAKLSNEIYSWSKDQREFVAQNIGLFLGMDPESITRALNDVYKSSIEKLSDLSNAAKIKGILELVDENGNTFDQNTIDAIVKDNNIKLSIDKDSFTNLDDIGKIIALRQGLFSNIQNADAADMTAQRTYAEGILQRYNKGAEGAQNWVSETIDNFTLLDKTLADFNADTNLFDLSHIQSEIELLNDEILKSGYTVDGVREKYAQVEDINLDNVLNAINNEQGNEDYRQFVSTLGMGNVDGQQVKDLVLAMKDIQTLDIWTEQLDAITKYNDYITSISGQLQEANEKLFDVKYLEQNKQLLADASTSLDNLQSSYKSITNIIKDYNDNQHLTLDNLQALLTMEPEYLACLEMDGNKMALNEEALLRLTQKRIDEAKALTYEQAALRIEAVIQAENTAAIYEENVAKLRATEVNGTLTGTIMTLTEAESLYGEAVKRAANLTSEQAAAVAEIQRETEMIINGYNSLDLSDFKSTFGSSGGGGSSKKDKELKQLDKEFDRYWQITKAIDKLSTTLERLNKLQDNLHGKELIRSLQKENALIEEQEQKYRELYDEQRKEAGELQGQLAEFGVAFGADGAILNYADATQRALAEFNNAVAAYNAGTLSDEAYDAAEKTYNAFKDALNRYDTLFYDEMKATQDKIIQAWKDKLANNLQAWETEIQIELDLSEAERDWNEFIHHISKDFKAVYENIPAELEKIIKDSATYTEDNGTIDVHIKAVNDVEKEVDKLMGGGDSDMFESVSQAQEKLKELMGDLENDATTVFDLWEKAWDNYLATIDQGKDKLDDLLDKMKNIGEELEFQGQLIELIYGDKTYALMTKLFDAQKNNSLLQVDSVRQQRDMWKKLYDEAEEGNEDRQKYYENWIEAQEQLNDLVVEHIELLKKDYLNAVSSIIDTVKKKTTGGDLEFAKQQWKDRQSMEKGFYDDTERVYQIETMQNKWEEMITNAPLNQQKKLTDLMNQQIEKLKDKTRLSEYDIGLAERELQITQARIDLENAQNSKNSMKVTRGTDGNWAYQYVADEDDVANKQQALLDAINDKYEYIKNKNQEVLESLLNNVDEYWTRYYEIMEDTTLKDEEREERLAELWETYYGEEGLLTVAYAEAEQTKQDLNQATFELLEEAYEQNQISYEEMTLAQQALIDGLKDGTISDYEDIQAACQVINDESLVSWQTMAQEMANAWNADDGQSIKSQVLAAMEECERALEEYGRELDYLAAVADMDFSESGITGSIDMADQATQELIMTTEVLIDEITSGISNAIGVVDQMAYAWQSVQSEILNAIGLLQEYLQLMGEEKSFNFDGITQGLAKGLEAIKSASGSGGSGSTTGTKGNKINGTFTYFTTDSSGNKLYKDQSTGKIYSETQLSSAADTSGTHAVLREATSLSKSYGIYGGTSGYQTPSGRVYPTQEAALNEMRSQSTYYGLTDEELKKYIKKFASGGYTGTWGSDGRLAMLHEKELVLNAADTKNILSVVDTVRDLSGLGSSISSVVAEGIASTLAKLAGIKAGNTTSYTTTNTANNSTSNNVFNVTIDGSQFRDVEELKEAILSLPNYAAQMRHSTLK